MAVLAVPPLVAAVDWLLVALGVPAVGAGAVVVTEEARRRQRAASEAGTGAAAQTATQTRTKACEKCPPDCGSLKNVNHHMSPVAREYQARQSASRPRTTRRPASGPCAALTTV